ncbi:MAG: lipopolysaccharide assembly protein LapA domain-containing protein [Brevinema sp.]
MQIVKSIFSAIIVIVFATFTLQNLQSVTINFFSFHFGAVPLFLVIIFVFVAGFITGRFTAWMKSAFTKK